MPTVTHSIPMLQIWNWVARLGYKPWRSEFLVCDWPLFSLLDITPNVIPHTHTPPNLTYWLCIGDIKLAFQTL